MGLLSKLSTRGIKRLEVTMRDVLDGLEDAASYINYKSSPDTIEILSMEPPSRLAIKKEKVIPIKLPFEIESSNNIVDYLIERELKKSA